MYALAGRTIHEGSARRARRVAWALASLLLVLAAAGSAALASPADQSVTYQQNAAHSGHIADAGLSAPLAQAWSITLPGAISYPLIVNGRVYVTTADKTLYALNQATGATAWSRGVGGTYPWSGLAYDAGQLFVSNTDGLVTAVDPVSGSLNWSKQVAGTLFDAPPTAADGIVYVGGAGALTALRARDGRVLWTRPVANGDMSSPALDAANVYVGYACQQVYGFARLTGAPQWHHTGPCSGGGGRTPVAAGGRVYHREAALGGNIVLSAAGGAVLGPFNADPSPAVAGGVMYTLDGTTLRAVSDGGLGTNQWQFTGDGGLTSAPLVAGGLVFAGSSTGALHAVDAATGMSAWSANVGSAIPAPDEQNVSQPLTGLGAANGTLVVPAGSTLTAYRTAGAITAAPANSAPPTIDGQPQVDRRLAADVGIWSGLPSSYAYAWQRCDGAGANCSDVAGASAATYTPATGEAGATLRVRVTATNAIGPSAAVTSGPSAVVAGPVPVNQAPPTISGTAASGQTLTAGTGAWSGSPTSYAYQWARCVPGPTPMCADVDGATSPTYVVTQADFVQQLLVRVTATNANGSSDPADSAPTTTVSPPVPVNTIPPSFSGLLQEGEVLTADPGTWSDNPTSYAYQWFSCDTNGVSCPDIAGATQPSYLVAASQVGRYIGVEVVATNNVGQSEPEPSDAFGPVIVGYPRNLAFPTIGGTTQDGQTLTAAPGSWTGSPTSYGYQWYGCDAAVTVCDLVAGATAATYRLGSADIGRRFGVGVVAGNEGGTSDEEFSDLTDPVRAIPATPPPPAAPPPPPPPPATTPTPAASSAFTTLKKRARADGALELSVQPREAGTFKASATAGASVLARGCLTRCSRSGRATFGSKTLKVSAAGIVKLVVKPSLRARRALRKSRSISVRVKVTFQSSRGGSPTSRTHTLSVKGTLGRRSSTRRVDVRAAARRQRAPALVSRALPRLAQFGR